MDWGIIGLALVFCVIAFLYASVGFGGGSSYTAILAMVGFSAATIPVIALSCNLVVATGGAIRFIRAGHLPWGRMAPLFILSIPLAYLAGRFRIAPGAYFLLLGMSLLVAAILLWRKQTAQHPADLKPLPVGNGLLIGGLLGALSGLTGIGGGIFLSPLLMLKGWALPKEAAATAAVYIVVNSLAGLLGQLSKAGSSEHVTLVLPLGVAVLLGGTFGSKLGAGKLSPQVMRKGTAALVALVSLRILAKSLGTVI